MAPSKRRRFLAIAALAVGAGGCGALAQWLRGQPASEIVAAGAVAAVLGLLGGLASEYELIARTVDRVFAGYFKAAFWMLVMIGPAVGARELSRILLERVSSATVQFAAFAIWGVLLAALLWLITTDRQRRRLFGWLRRAGALAPVVYSFNVLFLSVIFFGSVTFLLANRGALAFVDFERGALAPEKVVPGQVLDFFLWHFLDAIPLLDVPETVRWEPPLTYEHAGAGWILLLFKVVVVLPLFAAFVSYWKFREEDAAKEKAEKEQRAGGS